MASSAIFHFLPSSSSSLTSLSFRNSRTHLSQTPNFYKPLLVKASTSVNFSSPSKSPTLTKVRLKISETVYLKINFLNFFIFCFCRIITGYGNTRTILWIFITRNTIREAMSLVRTFCWFLLFQMLVLWRNGDQWLKTLLDEVKNSWSASLMLL